MSSSDPVMHRILPVAVALVAILHGAAEGSQRVDQLRDITGTFLQSMFAASEAQAQYTIEMTEHADGRIVAAIRNPVVHDDDIRLVIDDIVITYSPLDDVRYAASADIPSMSGFEGTNSMRFLVSEGTIECVMHIDHARCANTQINAADLLLKVEGHDSEDPVVIRLERFSGTSAFHESVPDLWSAHTSTTFIGLSASTGGMQLGIAEGRATGTMPDPATMLPRMAQGLPFGHVSGSLALLDVNWIDESGGGGIIGSVMMEHSLSAPDSDEATIRLRYSHEGLRIDDDLLAIPDVDLLPTSLALDIGLDAFPLSDVMKTVLAPSRNDPFDALVGLLHQGASQLDVELDYASPSLAASGSGHFTAAPLAIPATGEAGLVLEGFDDVVRLVGEAALSGNKAAGELVGFLSLWQVIGRKDERRHHYDFEFLPDNRILLNGNDLGVLLGVLGQVP